MRPGWEVDDLNTNNSRDDLEYAPVRVNSPEVPGCRRQVQQVLVVAFVLHQVPGEALVDQLEEKQTGRFSAGVTVKKKYRVVGVRHEYIKSVSLKFTLY